MVPTANIAESVDNALDSSDSATEFLPWEGQPDQAVIDAYVISKSLTSALKEELESRVKDGRDLVCESGASYKRRSRLYEKLDSNLVLTFLQAQGLDPSKFGTFQYNFDEDSNRELAATLKEAGLTTRWTSEFWVTKPSRST